MLIAYLWDCGGVTWVTISTVGFLLIAYRTCVGLMMLMKILCLDFFKVGVNNFSL